MLVPNFREECYETYSVQISPGNYVCARNAEGGGICYGDSGGPLFCESDGSFQLLGPTALTDRYCRTDKKPSGFTSVSRFRKWIRDNMDEAS
jgi:secreted trypsin-like serine protease